MAAEKPQWLEQMEDILETLNEGVLIRDDSGHALFVNAVLEEMTGYPREAILRKDAAKQLYAPEDFALIEQLRTKAQQERRIRHEVLLVGKDGSRIPVIVSARVLKDPDGRTFAILTYTDISEQKAAEAQLRTANQQLAERQKEIEEDLALAARVQQSLAPKPITWGNMRVDAFYLPMRTIGGDFGLVSPLDGQHLNLLVCDVSGHGIGSALIANRIYSEMITSLRSGTSLGDVLRQLNRFVMQNIGGSVFFFTLAAARWTGTRAAWLLPAQVIRPP